jgi:hypothetical protein
MDSRDRSSNEASPGYMRQLYKLALPLPETSAGPIIKPLILGLLTKTQASHPRSQRQRNAERLVYSRLASQMNYTRKSRHNPPPRLVSIVELKLTPSQGLS